MGKLITIVGNVASGKTTLTRMLGEVGGFGPYYEQHETMLFQRDFARDVSRYALPNQIDYLLFRADQERSIREAEHMGVQDGGLDSDYHLFTRLFHYKAFLDQSGYQLCQRLYSLLRENLPPPDVVVYLDVPLKILVERHTRRARPIDAQIVTSDDIPVLQRYLEEWLRVIEPDRLISLDAGQDDPIFSHTLPHLIDRLPRMLSA